MGEMHFTDEQPTLPGYYWLRGERYDGTEFVTFGIMYYHDHSLTERFFYIIGHEGKQRVSNFKWFYGPIEKPLRQSESTEEVTG